jgi:hypothetical protein
MMKSEPSGFQKIGQALREFASRERHLETGFARRAERIQIHV